MSEEAIKQLLKKNPAGLNKTDLCNVSKLDNKQAMSAINSMIRSKELIMYSGRVVLNDAQCVKECLLDVSMEHLLTICDKQTMSCDNLKKERMKAWIDTYVDGLDWKNGKLVSKLKENIWDDADLYNIHQLLAE